MKSILKLIFYFSTFPAHLNLFLFLFSSTSQFDLNTFQMLDSHTWLVAAILDSANLECRCNGDDRPWHWSRICITFYMRTLIYWPLFFKEIWAEIPSSLLKIHSPCLFCSGTPMNLRQQCAQPLPLNICVARWLSLPRRYDRAEALTGTSWKSQKRADLADRDTPLASAFSPLWQLCM